MPEITIPELKAKRNELQDDLLKMIAERVNNFQKDTGVNIAYVSVNMDTLSRIGFRPERIITNVTVDLDI